MSLSGRYHELQEALGECPIESGVAGQLADHECSHGHLPSDRRIGCGCWNERGPTPDLIAALRKRGVPFRP